MIFGALIFASVEGKKYTLFENSCLELLPSKYIILQYQECVSLTTLPQSFASVTKSGNLNFLEPPGPVQACNGTALPLPLPLPFTVPRNLASYEFTKHRVFIHIKYFIRCIVYIFVCQMTSLFHIFSLIPSLSKQSGATSRLFFSPVTDIKYYFDTFCFECCA